MEKYWVNASGYYDPTVAKAIESETNREKARDKQVHDTIQQIKKILNDRGLELGERIVLVDTRTKKKYK